MNYRVRMYEITTYYLTTGSSCSRKYHFTQAQADEVGGVLETDGLNIELARKLCDHWTRRRQQHEDIRYIYRIPLCPTNKTREEA